MPCKDSTALVSIVLDRDECVLRFDFSKITCGKTIGGGTGFEVLCAGRAVAELLEIPFAEFVEKLGARSTEDQFLLYLEWDAFQSAVLQYLGRGESLDAERYQIESILYDENEIEIRQVIRPPSEMPRIIPCSKQP